MKNKLFVVTKFVKAKSAVEAIAKAKGSPPDEVFIDGDWKKEESKKKTNLTNAIGFEVSEDE